MRTLPSWDTDFLAADKKMDGALTATLEAYADADMNVLKAAQRLNIHANTLYARLKRIRDATGLDARSYRQFTDLLLVAECRRLWQGKP